MATLLATLQEQGQRQEQLARDQATQFGQQLEHLAEEQQKRYGEVAQDFTRQLEQLAQDQRQTWERWTEKLQGIEERILGLEDELQSFKRETFLPVKSEQFEGSHLDPTATTFNPHAPESP